jgi:hypothetical protein
MEFLTEILIFLATAFAIGSVGNIAGIGGGVLLMVVLLFVFKMNPVLAGRVQPPHHNREHRCGFGIQRQGQGDRQEAFLCYCMAAGTGAVIGSVASYFIAVGTFDLAFGFTSLSLGIFSLAATKIEARKNRGKAYLKESFNEYRVAGGVLATPGQGTGPARHRCSQACLRACSA